MADKEKKVKGIKKIRFSIVRSVEKDKMRSEN